MLNGGIIHRLDGNDNWVWDALDLVIPRTVIIETHIEFGYKQLRKILTRYNYELDDPDGNAVSIYRLELERPLFRPPKTVRQHVATIKYPRESVVISIVNIKYVRRVCKLQEEDGGHFMEMAQRLIPL